MAEVDLDQPGRACVINGVPRCGAVALVGGRTLVCHDWPGRHDSHRCGRIEWRA